MLSHLSFFSVGVADATVLQLRVALSEPCSWLQYTSRHLYDLYQTALKLFWQLVEAQHLHANTLYAF